MLSFHKSRLGGWFLLLWFYCHHKPLLKIQFLIINSIIHKGKNMAIDFSASRLSYEKDELIEKNIGNENYRIVCVGIFVWTYNHVDGMHDCHGNECIHCKIHDINSIWYQPYDWKCCDIYFSYIQVRRLYYRQEKNHELKFKKIFHRV